MKAPRHHLRAGLTLVELVIAMAILAVAAGFSSSTVLALVRQREINRAQAVAAEAIRGTLEGIRNEEFREVFALYDPDPLDDPGGPGTAPGPGFPVDELTLCPGDADGMAGEIEFPWLEEQQGLRSVWRLREDQPNRALGLPRDLNGDGFIDDADHAGDYILLPVTVRVRWQGEFGPQEHEITTTLVGLLR